jgi:hypothetical protein
MTAKTIEVRDRGTFIPMLAIGLDSTNEADRYLLARAGYGVTPEEQDRYVLLARIDGGEGKIQCDPYDWGTSARTVPVAHRWLIEHFDEIASGAVVDVEFILGETSQPKVSEAVTNSVP